MGPVSALQKTPALRMMGKVSRQEQRHSLGDLWMMIRDVRLKRQLSRLTLSDDLEIHSVFLRSFALAGRETYRAALDIWIRRHSIWRSYEKNEDHLHPWPCGR